MKKSLKKPVLFIFKFAVSAILIMVAFQRIDPVSLQEYLSSISTGMLLLILMPGLLNLTLQYFRFRQIVVACRHSVSHAQLLKAFLMGFAFRLTVPGGHGDAAKMFFVPGSARKRITVIGIEKLTISAVQILLFGPAAYLLFPDYPRLLFISLIPVVAFFALYVFRKRPELKRHLIEGTRYRRISGQTALLTLGIYALFFLQYFMLLRSFGVSYFQTAAVCVFVMGASALPVSVSGLGIRENTAAWLLSGYGVPAAAGIGVPLIIFILNVVFPAVAGGIIFFLHKTEQDNNEN